MAEKRNDWASDYADERRQLNRDIAVQKSNAKREGPRGPRAIERSEIVWGGMAHSDPGSHAAAPKPDSAQAFERSEKSSGEKLDGLARLVWRRVSCPAPEPVLGIASPQACETPAGAGRRMVNKGVCEAACRGALPRGQVLKAPEEPGKARRRDSALKLGQIGRAHV